MLLPEPTRFLLQVPVLLALPLLALEPALLLLALALLPPSVLLAF